MLSELAIIALIPTVMQSFSVSYDCYWYWIKERHNQSPERNTTNIAMIGQPSDDLDPMSLALGSSSGANWNYNGVNMDIDESALATFFGMNDNFGMWNTSNDVSTG